MDEEAALREGKTRSELSTSSLASHLSHILTTVCSVSVHTSSRLSSEEVDVALWRACQSGDTDAAFAAVEEGASVNKEHEQVSAYRPVVLHGLCLMLSLTYLNPNPNTSRAFGCGGSRKNLVNGLPMAL